MSSLVTISVMLVAALGDLTMSTEVNRQGEVTMLVTRHQNGDRFSPIPVKDAKYEVQCNSTFCYEWGGLGSRHLDGNTCHCRCVLPHATYRQDIGACVEDVSDCPLVDFSVGNKQEKIPLVTLPEQGHLVYPTAEITMTELGMDAAPVLAPVCVVTGSSLMTRQGWRQVNSTFESPFRLHRHRHQTYLRWTGKGGVDASTLHGRLVLVQLLCKDAGNEMRPRFRPCVAFRVAGTDGDVISSGQSSSRAGVIVGVCVFLLAAAYVAAVAAYLTHRRRRKNRIGSQLIEQALMRPCKDRHETSRENSPPNTQLISNGATSSSVHDSSVAAGTTRSQLQPEFNTSTDSPPLHDYESELAACLKQRLYFNSEFFNPDQLQDPPEEAQEFLVRIREMISLAKLRMQAKQFVPSLEPIEESGEEYGGHRGQRAHCNHQHRHPAAATLAPSKVDIAQWLERAAHESSLSDSGDDRAPNSRTIPKTGVLSSAEMSRQKKWTRLARSRPVDRQRRCHVTDGTSERRRASDTNGPAVPHGTDEADDRDLCDDDDDDEAHDSLTDLVSEAESKLPKLISDEESIYGSCQARVVCSRSRLTACLAQLDSLVESQSPCDDASGGGGDQSVSFGSERASVTIGDGGRAVVCARGKMTISLQPQPTTATDVGSVAEWRNSDTPSQRRPRTDRQRTSELQRSASFYDDSLERKRRGGGNFNEKFETTHINVNCIQDISDHCSNRAFASGLLVDSGLGRFAHHRQDHTSDRQQPIQHLIVGSVRRSQRRLKTFKDYSTVKLAGGTSLIDQWKKSHGQYEEDDAVSPAYQSMGQLNGVESDVVAISQEQRLTGRTEQADTTAPPPKKSSITRPSEVPPLPPRNHSPQRESKFAQRSIGHVEIPAIVRHSQPPLPPKLSSPKPACAIASPPPLPVKIKHPPLTPPPPPPFVSSDHAPAARISQCLQRRNSVGDSETNSTASSQCEATSSGAGCNARIPSSSCSSLISSDPDTRLSNRTLDEAHSANSIEARSQLSTNIGGNVLQRIAQCERNIGQHRAADKPRSGGHEKQPPIPTASVIRTMVDRFEGR